MNFVKDGKSVSQFCRLTCNVARLPVGGEADKFNQNMKRVVNVEMMVENIR